MNLAFLHMPLEMKRNHRIIFFPKGKAFGWAGSSFRNAVLR